MRLCGVATEWDFVEAPSQLLEEWAWDAGVLERFATDDAGRPIPAALVARMREANDFAKGLQTRTQMFYAALSYRAHQDPPDDMTRPVARAAGGVLDGRRRCPTRTSTRRSGT